MARVFLISTLLSALLCSGCESFNTKDNGQQALTETGLSQAQADLNRQVGDYMSAVYEERRKAPPAEDHWCGRGDVDFDLVSVAYDLLVTSDVTESINGGVAAPLSFVTVGATASGSQEKISAQELKYAEHILDDRYQPIASKTEITGLLLERSGRGADRPKEVRTADGRKQSYELASQIFALRNALRNADLKIESSGPKPCYIDFDPAKPGDAPHQFIISLKAISDDKGGLTFALGPLTLGGSVESKPSFTNTITVSFKQHGIDSKTQVGPCQDNPQELCVFQPKPKSAFLVANPAATHPSPGAKGSPSADNSPNTLAEQRMCSEISKVGVMSLRYFPCPDQSDLKEK